MPGPRGWMGKETGVVFPLAFRKVNIFLIVSSDLNLIHGVIRYERVCTSFYFV